MKVGKDGSRRFYGLWSLLLSAVAHFGVVAILLISNKPVNSFVMQPPLTRGLIMMIDVYPDGGLLPINPLEKVTSADDSAVLGSADIQPVAERVTTQSSVKANDAYVDGEPIEAKPIYTNYLPTTALSKPPSIRVDIPSDMTFPATTGLSRLAVLRLLITESGDVTQVLVEEASVSEEDLTFLKDAFLKTKFYAGEINGTSVKSQLKIEIELNEAITENSDL